MQEPSDLDKGTQDLPQDNTVLEALRRRRSVGDALLPTDLPLAPVIICNGALNSIVVNGTTLRGYFVMLPNVRGAALADIQLCVDGRSIHITGINYFGFDVRMPWRCMPKPAQLRTASVGRAVLHEYVRRQRHCCNDHAGR